MNNSGDVYIGDVGNYRVRLVTKHPLVVSNVGMWKYGNVEIYPNPCNNRVTVQVNSAVREETQVSIRDIRGIEVNKFIMQTNLPVTIEPDWPPGVYVVSVTTAQQHFTEKLIIQ